MRQVSPRFALRGGLWHDARARTGESILTAFRTLLGAGLAIAAAATLNLAAPATAKKNTWTVKVGPIWNQADAERKCPRAARAEGGRWTGQWWTTKPGKQSVCQLSSRGGARTRTVEVGPIWNQADAEVKCRQAARRKDARWTGKWWTTIPGRMSVCEIRKR